MPKFHIALRTESTVSDTLDIERDNPTDLRVELARFVGEMLKDTPTKSGWMKIGVWT